MCSDIITNRIGREPVSSTAGWSVRLAVDSV